MPYCPDCGTENDTNAAYCSNCGRDLGGGQDDSWGDSGDDWGGSDGSQDDSGWGSSGSDRDSGDGESWAEYSSGDDQPDPDTAGAAGQGDQPGNPTGPPGPGGRQGRGGGQGGGNSWEGGQQGGWEGGQGQRREWSGSNRQPQDALYVEDGKVEYAAKLPFSDGWGPLGMSGLFMFLSIFLLPFFFIEGYLYRITEAAAWGDTIQPRFNEYGDMFVTGLKMFGLYFLYGVGGIAIIAVLFVAGDAAGLTAIGGLLAAVFGLVWFYFGPAVLTLYPATGSFGAALSPSRIAEFARTGKYFVSFRIYIALYFAVSFALNIVLTILVITIIGIIIAIPVYLISIPYMLYLTGAYWGGTYYEAAQEGLVTPPWDEDQSQEPYETGEAGGATEW